MRIYGKNNSFFLQSYSYDLPLDLLFVTDFKQESLSNFIKVNPFFLAKSTLRSGIFSGFS